MEDELGMDVKFKVKAFDEKDEIYEALKLQNIDWTEEYVDDFESKYAIMREDVKHVPDDDESISELFFKKQQINYRYCNKTFYGLDNNGLYKIVSDKAFRNLFSNYMKEFVKEMENHSFEIQQKLALALAH
jgi:hypothetical protein